MSSTHPIDSDVSADPTAAATSRRRMRKLAVPVAAVAGGVAISLGSGIPTVMGALAFNHNETLLPQSPRPDASLSVGERSILARFAGRSRRAARRTTSHGAFLVL